MMMPPDAAPGRGGRSGRRRRPARPRPEALEPRRLLATFIVTSAADAGPGTLREAIERANETPGADLITFAIPGNGPRTIAPRSPLPRVAEAVAIDGESQPGSRANSRLEGTNAAPLIVLDGSAAGPGADGLELGAGGSLVRGLVIRGFDGAGFRVTGPGNRIEGNFIGTDAAGIAAAGNGTGIVIVGADANLVGGTAPAARNLISGNRSGGVQIVPFIRYASPRPIPIFLTPSNDNRILGNLIGTDASGERPLGNGFNGVEVNSGVNAVGGVEPGAGNVIAFNEGAGVRGLAIISTNSIFDNGGLGIDIGFDGPERLGPDDLPGLPVIPRAPLLTAVEPVAGGVLVRGELRSVPLMDHRLEFFADAGDPSGFGEGRFPLGSAAVTTDAAGFAGFEVVLPPPPGGLPAITATATPADTSLGTSEFSPASNRALADLEVTIDLEGGDSFVLSGREFVLRATVTNRGPAPATAVTLTVDIGDGSLSFFKGPSRPAIVLEIRAEVPGASGSGEGTGVATSRLGDLPVGASATVTIRAVAPPAVEPTVWNDVLARASAESEQLDAFGPLARDLRLPVDPHDLSLTVGALPERLRVGQRAVIPFRVANAGPATAEAATISVFVVLGIVRVVSVSTPSGEVGPGNTGNFPLGPLDPGAAVEGTMTIEGVWPGAGLLSVFARDDRNFNDQDPGNEFASITIPVLAAAPADFDGDGRSDLAVYTFDPAAGLGRFTIERSGGGTQTVPFGGPSDQPVSGDFDGDGRADVAVFGFSPLEGVTRLAYIRSSDGIARSVVFGGPSDRPIIGDFDGDGQSDLAVYGLGPDGVARFAVLPSFSPDGAYLITFGGPGDLPLAGDFDGDGQADLAVFGFSPLDGFSRFAVLPSASRWAAFAVPFGGAGDGPVVGDFDGDGRDDIAVFGFSPLDGAVRLAVLPSRPNDPAFSPAIGGFAVAFGGIDDAPIAADYDDDGLLDVAVFGYSVADRAARFAILRSSDGRAGVSPIGTADSVGLPTSPGRFRPPGTQTAAARLLAGSVALGAGADPAGLDPGRRGHGRNGSGWARLVDAVLDDDPDAPGPVGARSRLLGVPGA